MKRLHLVLALAVMTALVGVSPASAQQSDKAQGKTEAEGGVQITVHTHSNDDPEWTGLLFNTDRLSFDFTEGEDFTYSSRPCDLPAAFNELALDFSPDHPGVDDDADGTAPVRHRVEGTITSIHGNTGTIEGTITTVMCENEALSPERQESENVIVTHFEARFHRVSDNEIRVTGTWSSRPPRAPAPSRASRVMDPSKESSPAWPTSATRTCPPAPNAGTSPTSSEHGVI